MHSCYHQRPEKLKIHEKLSWLGLHHSFHCRILQRCPRLLAGFQRAALEGRGGNDRREKKRRQRNFRSFTPHNVWDRLLTMIAAKSIKVVARPVKSVMHSQKYCYLPSCRALRGMKVPNWTASWLGRPMWTCSRVLIMSGTRDLLIANLTPLHNHTNLKLHCAR